ncbi:hypothetical protein Bca101_011596 [Brassica carinata]
MGGGGGMEELTEDEKRALRVAPLTSLPSSYGSQPPRKLQDPNGLSSIDPELIELAVKTARDTVVSIDYIVTVDSSALAEVAMHYLLTLLVVQVAGNEGDTVVIFALRARNCEIVAQFYLRKLVGLQVQEEQSSTLPPLKTSRYLLMTIR